MTTTQSIIEAGYARSTASDAGKLAVDGELLAHVNRKFQSTFARFSSKAGDSALAKSTLTWASSPAAVALPTDIVDIVRIETATGGRTYLIPAKDKDRTNWHLPPAFMRIGSSLVSRGNSGDPVAGDVYTIFYKDAPATLSALSTALDARFPVRYESLLIIDVALYLSVKNEGGDVNARAAIRDELAREEKIFAELIGESNTAKESTHQPAPGNSN